MSQELFLKLLEKDQAITGKFIFEKSGDFMMDRDFINKKFVDCELWYGDFASGIFKSCTFDRVLFKNLSLVGVNFTNCDFINCKFSNVETSASFNDCTIKHLIITKEIP